MKIEEYLAITGWQEFKSPSGFTFHIKKISALTLSTVLKGLSGLSQEDLESGNIPLERFDDLFLPVLKECVQEVKEGKIPLEQLDPNDALAMFNEVYKISNLEEAAQAKKFRPKQRSRKKHK